jgi:hypothetical protein
MAHTPAQYNIRPQRRADFPLSIMFKDSVGTPLNLLGWTIVAQVWDTKRTAKLGDWNVSMTNPALGAVDLKLDHSVTEILPNESRYDVMLVSPEGLREYYLEGIVRPSEGYSVP